jgi:predicted HD superfamily hydrolase involved in NAD metabolism
VNKLETIRNYLKKNLSSSRFAHCEGTEKLSLLFAQRFNLSPIQCGLAGLAHDICREMSDDELISYTGISHPHPMLLHGKAGAKMLKEFFGIDDGSVLNAVKFHISGSSGLDSIGKVIFAADYLEEGRTHVNLEDRNRLFLLDLDDMVLDIALQNREYLKNKACVIDPDLDKLIYELQEVKH